MGENEEAPQAPPPLEWDSVPSSKKEIRDKIWDYINKYELANFPTPVTDRIPNFKGADVASEKIHELKSFESAKVVRVNQDKPQEGVRYHTMKSQKDLLVQTPRQKNGLFYKIVPPSDSEEDLKKCATQQGVRYHREAITLENQVKIDVVICGSVAVSKKGYRVGKGEGYADLEYAMMKAFGAIDDTTPIITVVHDCQILDIPDELMEDHDFDVDYILTPTQLIECQKERSKPKGLIWSKVTRNKLRRLPVLRRLYKMEKEAGQDVTLKFVPRTQRPPKDKSESDKADVEEEGERPPARRGRGGRRGRGRGFGGRRGRNFSRSRRRQQSEQSGDEGKENHDPNSEPHENEEDEESRPRYSDDGRGRGRGRSRGRGSRFGGRQRYGNYRSYQGKRDLDPAVYIGGIGEEVRVSAFKTVVRERGVSPIQVLWRGKKGYAFLVFKDLETAETALKDLDGIKYEDCNLTVKLSNKFISEEPEQA